MCLAVQNRQKSIKLLFWRSRSFNVIEFGGSRKPAYDFLLVTDSNLSHLALLMSYSDLLANIANFSHPLLI